MERQEFRCERCGQSFGSAADLDKHNNQMHPNTTKTPAQGTSGGERSEMRGGSEEDNEENEDEDTEEE